MCPVRRLSLLERLSGHVVAAVLRVLGPTGDILRLCRFDKQAASV